MIDHEQQPSRWLEPADNRPVIEARCTCGWTEQLTADDETSSQPELEQRADGRWYDHAFPAKVWTDDEITTALERIRNHAAVQTSSGADQMPIRLHTWIEHEAAGTLAELVNEPEFERIAELALTPEQLGSLRFTPAEHRPPEGDEQSSRPSFVQQPISVRLNAALERHDRATDEVIEARNELADLILECERATIADV